MLIELPSLETIVKANRSRFFFVTEAYAPGALEVASFKGEEKISVPYTFTVQLWSDDPDLDLKAMVGQPASLVMMREMGNPRPIHGVVTEMSQTGRVQGRFGYAATLKPRLSLLEHAVRSRVFQQESVQEIVSRVLADGGVSVDDQDWQLEDELPEREYCVQYQESDLTFVRRLLEHEGIYFFFRQDAQREVVVFGDRPAAHPSAEGSETIEYGTRDGFTNEAETVHDCSVRDQVVSAQVVLNDYNYRDAMLVLRNEAEVAGGQTGVVHQYGAHYKTREEGDRLARARSEEIACQQRELSGKSDAYGFRSGHLFTLGGHFRGELNREYLLTEVVHEGSQRTGGGFSGRLMDTTYTNTFKAIPSNVPFRPKRDTQPPRVHGVMTASIEARPGSKYAYLDGEGRYWVKMPFDLEEREPIDSSRPVRLAQPYTGTGYGMHFPTHGGAEMVFSCIDGDIDRPIGLGTVPHSSRSSPVTSENKMENVIRTVAHHELVFDDCLNDEQIRLRSMGKTKFFTKRSKEQEIGEDETHQVGGERSIEVKGSHRETVGGSQTVKVAGTQTETVGQAKAETIALAKALSIGAAYQVSVAGAMNETVGGAKAEEVAGAKVSFVGAHSEERVTKNKSVRIDGGLQETIGENAEMEVGANSVTRVGRTMAVEVGENITVKVGGHGRFEFEEGVTFASGDASITIDRGGIQVDGDTVDINARGSVTLNGRNIDLNP